MILSFIAGAFVLTSLAGQAQASGSEGVSQCQIVYGGGQTCKDITKFTIDKKVQRTTKGGEFVDNLSMNDEKFAPEQQITFKITVKNTGDKTIEDLDVADILPQELVFVSGPGNFDTNTRTLSYRIESLDAGKTHENTFVVKSKPANELPADKGIICTTNTARSVAQDNSTAQDTSEVCIQKSVVTKPGTPQVFKGGTVKETPSTGPEMLALIGLIPAGAAGMYLRRKSVK